MRFLSGSPVFCLIASATSTRCELNEGASEAAILDADACNRWCGCRCCSCSCSFANFFQQNCQSSSGCSFVRFLEAFVCFLRVYLPPLSPRRPGSRGSQRLAMTLDEESIRSSFNLLVWSYSFSSPLSYLIYVVYESTKARSVTEFWKALDEGRRRRRRHRRFCSRGAFHTPCLFQGRRRGIMRSFAKKTWGRS